MNPPAGGTPGQPDDDATARLSMPPRSNTPPRRLRSSDLLAGDNEVEIQHDTQVYRLRRTSLGKLILTK